MRPKHKASPVDEEQKLKAFSSKHPKEPNIANYYHLDCEYNIKHVSAWLVYRLVQHRTREANKIY